MPKDGINACMDKILLCVQLHKYVSTLATYFDRRLSKRKLIHHGGAICRVKRHGYCIYSHILEATSLWWVGSKRGQRVFFINYINRPRNNSKLINFILVIMIPQLDCPQNDWIVLPPHSLPVEPPLLSLLHQTHVFLVGCCVDSLSGSHLRPQHILFPFFCHLIWRPKWRENASLTSSDPVASLLRHPPPPPVLSFGWLFRFLT